CVRQPAYSALATLPRRHACPVRTSAELTAIRDSMTEHQREHLVLLLGPGDVGWDDLLTLQELAMLAVGRDVSVSVVTADPFAASLATASGIPVITQARFSDEVGMAESLIEQQQT